jgi:hypothetical protein
VLKRLCPRIASCTRIAQFIHIGTIAFVVKANAKKWTRADSLMREKISLIARFNSLQGLKKFPVRMRRELAHKALS